MSNFRFVFTHIESYLDKADPNLKARGFNHQATLGNIRSSLPVANKRWRADILRCTVGTVTIKLRDYLKSVPGSDDSESDSDSQDECRSKNRFASSSDSEEQDVDESDTEV